MATLLYPTIITTAVGGSVSAPILQFRRGVVRQLTIEVVLVYGSGGTTIDAYVQTSLDGGTSWIDIANANFTTAAATKVYNLSSLTPVTTVYTPTDGTLASNTAKDGIIGNQIRVKYKSTGTYAGGTTLTVHVQSDGLTQ